MNVFDLRAMELKASPAPWIHFYKHKYDEWHVGVSQPEGGMKLALFSDGCPTERPEGDAALIATLRTLAPELIGLWLAVDRAPHYLGNDIREAMAALEVKASTMPITQN